jgi:DNA helicase-2/ATP-dependent DNA helicase PcrA
MTIPIQDSADITPIIAPLNAAQRAAVTAPPQAMLVLAGAGSGKTRVLVHRIVWHIKVNQLAPQSILAVTFTNKAAKEMRGRIEELLGTSIQAMWVGTFHGLAHRLLRRHSELAKLPPAFQVMDSSDQLRLIKRLLGELNLDEKKWSPREVQWYINAQKDEGHRARELADDYEDNFKQQMLLVYRNYETLCERSGLVDFAELLLRAYELLRDNRDLLAFYQQRFQQVHVDEFQDTNTIQYAWLRLLTEGCNNLFVVGDDDQSIYGWRGAKIENIYQFQAHYPQHQVVKLEQNYRSTSTILNAANQVIAKNLGRMGKELWTSAGDGELILSYIAINEIDEANFVVSRIKDWEAGGGLRSDAAILYRSNAQSRQFEEKLMATATPYRVYGGLRFFDRAEIKNALSYLRLLANRHDDASFERVINTPTRGIGNKTLDDIRMIASTNEISLWSAAMALANQKVLAARASNALGGFLTLINQLDEFSQHLELYEKVKVVIEQSGLIPLYERDKADKGEERIENLKELVNAAKLFDYDANNEDGLGELDAFLSHAALESGDMQADEFDDCVQLMTLHTAKGLEFKLVFMVGMEEGLFPAQQSIDNAGRLEEERRLCYVGITRAMQQLVVTYADSRKLYGRETYPRKSRFLREIPAHCIKEIRTLNSRPAASPAPVAVIKKTANRSQLDIEHRYQKGQRVRHEKFGDGVVVDFAGQGDKESIQIQFKTAGMKWLVLAYVSLEAL